MSDGQTGGSTGNDSTMAMLCHVLALTALVGVPFGQILGPLIIWLIKKDASPMVDAHGKESLNFQISWTIWMIIAGLLIFVLIGIVLLPALMIAWLILTIVGSLKAANGELYRYPLTIRMLT